MVRHRGLQPTAPGICLEMGPAAPTKPWITAASWNPESEPPSEAAPTFLKQKLCEIINVSCFKLQSFRIIYYAATEKPQDFSELSLC